MGLANLQDTTHCLSVCIYTEHPAKETKHDCSYGTICKNELLRLKHTNVVRFVLGKIVIAEIKGISNGHRL